MNKRPPTLKDVALLAGTSKMAVSTVLNDTKSTVGVSESVRERILKALNELQYRPNAMARSLRAEQIGTVGFYCSAGYINSRDPWMRAIFHGLTEGLAANERDLLIYNALFGRRRDEAIQRMLSNKVDAVIVLPAPDDNALAEAIHSTPVLVISLAEPLGELPLVCADDAGGSVQMARHLVEAGHRCILYRRSSLRYKHEEIRYNAFCETVRRLGGEVIVAEASDPMDRVTDFEPSLLLERRNSQKITAVACWRDYSAMRILNFCATNGIRVPGDVAVAGFDGLAHTGLAAGVSLTTVDAHWQQVSRTATDIIAAMISGTSPAKQTVLPTELRIGNTT